MQKESAPAVMHPVRIHGGIESERDGRSLWLWVAADGRESSRKKRLPLKAVERSAATWSVGSDGSRVPG